MNSQSSSKFFEDIEKLRGFACILVLFQHLIWICPYYFLISIIPQCFSVGSGAVHVFFAISGFVITYSLSKNTEDVNGSFLENLKKSNEWIVKFYRKRLFRIFPVVLVVILVLGIALQIRNVNSSWQSLLVSAPFEILVGTFNNTVDLLVSKSLVYVSGIGPFWTLAVESQFYLLWPLVLLLCKNDNQRAVVSLVLGLTFSLVIVPVVQMYLGKHYYWTVNNVSELFLGAFLAYLYKSGFQINCSQRLAKFMGIGCAFLLWLYPSVMMNYQDMFMEPLIETFASVSLVALCVFKEGSFSFVGFNKFFQYLGQRSFSFYTIQLSLANIIAWIFSEISWLPKEELDFYQFLIFIMVLFVVTELLYRLIERTTRRL